MAGQVPQGVIAKPLQGAEREAKDRTGTEIAATRVPKGNPWGREAPESPTRALEEARAGLLGLCRQPRGCRSRYPRTRRTFAEVSARLKACARRPALDTPQRTDKKDDCTLAQADR